VLLFAGGTSSARAQTPPIPGVIEGEVLAGAGATVDVDNVAVQLVGLSQGARTLQETRTSGGRFRFDLPSVGGNATYIVRAEVEGVTYLAPTAVLLSPDVPSARVEIAVYPSTTERPALTSQASGVTVLFVDVRASTVLLQREDLVVNPSTRTWLGDAEGVTLRLPVGADLGSLEGEAWYDGLPALVELTPSGSEVLARVVLRPGVTLVTTRFTLPVDLNAVEASLRVTSALPAERLQVLVPERFTRRLEPGPGAVLGEPFDLEGERVLVVESAGGVEAGAVLEARPTGLGGRINPSALASRSGAFAGAALALAIIAGGAHVLSRVGGRQSSVTGVEGA
jgi:hypothetical protein